MIRARCVSAVFVVMPSAVAISLLAAPSASSCRTSRSREVRRLALPRVDSPWLSGEARAADACSRSEMNSAVAQDRSHGLDQGAAGLGLQHVAARAGVERRLHDLLGVVHGDDQHRHGHLAQYPAGHLEAVQLRQPDIQDHEVRPQLEGQGERLPAGGGFAAYGPGRLAGQDGAHALPHQFVVVRDQDPDGASLS